jgi:hypothetical protein
VLGKDGYGRLCILQWSVCGRYQFVLEFGGILKSDRKGRNQGDIAVTAHCWLVRADGSRVCEAHLVERYSQIGSEVTR